MILSTVSNKFYQVSINVSASIDEKKINYTVSFFDYAEQQSETRLFIEGEFRMACNYFNEEFARLKAKYNAA